MKKRKDEWKQWWEEKTQEWRVGRKQEEGTKEGKGDKTEMIARCKKGKKVGRKMQISNKRFFEHKL